MAKKRRPAGSTRKASSARKGVKRKSAPRRRARKAAAKPSKSLNLKQLREQIALAVSALSRKVGPTRASESKLDDTRRRLSQWMTDIDDICSPEDEEICGPTMVLPLP